MENSNVVGLLDSKRSPWRTTARVGIVAFVLFAIGGLSGFLLYNKLSKYPEVATKKSGLVSNADWFGIEITNMKLVEKDAFDEFGILKVDEIEKLMNKQDSEDRERTIIALRPRSAKTRGPDRTTDKPNDEQSLGDSEYYQFRIGSGARYKVHITAIDPEESPEEHEYIGFASYIVGSEMVTKEANGNFRKAKENGYVSFCIPVAENGYFIAPISPELDYRFVTIEWGDQYLPGNVIAKDDNLNLALIKTEGSNFPVLRFPDQNLFKPSHPVWSVAFGGTVGIPISIKGNILSTHSVTPKVELMLLESQEKYGARGGAVFDQLGRFVGMTNSNPAWFESKQATPAIVSAKSIENFLISHGIQEIDKSGGVGLTHEDYAIPSQSHFARIVRLDRNPDITPRQHQIRFNSRAKIRRPDQVSEIPFVAGFGTQTGLLAVDRFGEVKKETDGTNSDQHVPFALGELYSIGFVKFPLQSRESWKRSKTELLNFAGRRSENTSSSWRERVSQIPVNVREEYEFESESEDRLIYRLKRNFSVEIPSNGLFIDCSLQGHITFNKKIGWPDEKRLKGSLVLKDSNQEVTIQITALIERESNEAEINDLIATNVEKQNELGRLYSTDSIDLKDIEASYQAGNMEWTTMLNKKLVGSRGARHTTAERVAVMNWLERGQKAQPNFMFRKLDWCDNSELIEVYVELTKSKDYQRYQGLIDLSLSHRHDPSAIFVLLDNMRRNSAADDSFGKLGLSLLDFGEAIEPVLLNQLYGCKSEKFAKLILGLIIQLKGPRSSHFLREHAAEIKQLRKQELEQACVSIDNFRKATEQEFFERRSVEEYQVLLEQLLNKKKSK